MGGNPYASLLEDIKIFGESYTDGTNLDVIVEFGQFFSQNLPSAHFIYTDKEGYINAEVLREFVSLYTGFTGTPPTSAVSGNYVGKFIEIDQFVELTSGKEEAEKYKEQMDGSSKIR